MKPEKNPDQTQEILDKRVVSRPDETNEFKYDPNAIVKCNFTSFIRDFPY